MFEAMIDSSQHVREVATAGVDPPAVLRIHAGAFAAVSTVIALMKKGAGNNGQGRNDEYGTQVRKIEPEKSTSCSEARHIHVATPKDFQEYIEEDSLPLPHTG